MKTNLLKHLPTICTTLGCVGVVGTSVMSAKATPRACEVIAEYNKSETMCADDEPYHVTLNSWDDLDIIEKGKALAPVYAPSAVACAGTIACIILSDIFSRKYHAAVTKSLAASLLMYKASTDAFKKYELERRAEQYDYSHRDPEKIFVYDEYFLEPVEVKKEDVIEACYHFNRNFALRGYGNLHELYEFIYDDVIEVVGDDPMNEFGWSIDMGLEMGYTWVDFYLECVDEEKQVYKLGYPFEPLMGYMYGWDDDYEG